MPKTASILSLGTRTDALTWKNGVTKLGAKIIHDVREPTPDFDDLKAFFKGSEEWLFISGHFTDSVLFNEAYHQDPKSPNGVAIEFSDKYVIIQRGNKSEKLEAGKDFKQNANCKVVFWGGCNTNTETSQVKTLRNLFGKHTLIGWIGKTGWQILHIVMGGNGHDAPNPKTDFFQRLGSKADDPVVIRDAWLEAGIEANWGDGGKTDKKFSVIDPNGAGFIIKNNKVAPDPAFPAQP